MTRFQFDQYYTWAESFLQKWRIDLSNPRLCRTLLSIDKENPQEVDFKTLQWLIQQLKPFYDYFESPTGYPVIVAPPGTFKGRIHIGNQVGNNMPLFVEPLQCVRNMTFTGPVGTGKTTILHNVQDQLLTSGVKILALDIKDDMLYQLKRWPKMLLLSGKSKLPMLQKPEWLSINDFISLLAENWKKTMYSGEIQAGLLTRALDMVFKEQRYPCWNDVKTQLDSFLNWKGRTMGVTDGIYGLLNRLRQLETQFPEPFHCRRGVSWETLFSNSLVMNAQQLTSSISFLFLLFINLLFTRQRAHADRDNLSYLIYTDEGYQLWSKLQKKNIYETSHFSELQSLLREFSCGVCLSSVNLSHLDPISLSTTNIFVVLGATSGEEVRMVQQTLNLEKHQLPAVSRLQLGMGLLNVKDGGWNDAVLFKFPHRKQFDKRVSFSDRESFEQRINQLIPADKPAPNILPRTQESARGEHADPSPKTSITEKERKLLEAVVMKIQPSTSSYRDAGIEHNQVGHRLKQSMVAKGLLKEQRIIGRAGRGGWFTALQPTQKAIQTFGLKRPKLTRGGDSLQHQYLCQEYAALIPGAKVDFKLGDKSMDLFFLYKDTLHRTLFKNLILNSHPLTKTPLKFPEDDGYCCIEIEVSSSNNALCNVEKDHDAGACFIIEAVMPSHVDKAVQHLMCKVPEEIKPRVAVMDALILLDALRGFSDGESGTD
ncbi:MAG TPA: hypothetical protein PK014_08375 [Thermoanaerobaculia bacterium]|nr:hypothetical protein [Thermoanaerobaculia bacterium]HUM30156.1 hypothetical protein [Thermoanaerobaculia bacterium]HXK68394.1 hypothetical protein [Thermoanaerobaculia bacterium]